MNLLIATLAERNPADYNLLKAVEELNELSTVLMQKHNKMGGVKEPSDQKVIDEIGDVQIRLDILKVIFGEAAVENRIQEKYDKFKNYLSENKYRRI